jgi:glycosyltransferase involved in cell wall biosynthesis
VRNPVVYTVLTSLRHIAKPRRLKFLAGLHCIVVSNERDASILHSWGLTNYAVVPPAIETTRLTQSALPIGDEITLLMASAPWIEEQFEQKGVDDLLEAAANIPKLRLILLWRGLLLNELRQRVARHGIGDRVEIVTERVDIDDYLRRAHAAVLAPKRSDIVKAYPHSLLESLFAGKPVILSAALPMADYVRQQGCGIVVEDVDPKTLMQAIDDLRSRYDELAQRARLVDPQQFSQQAMIDRYRDIYTRADRGRV